MHFNEVVSHVQVQYYDVIMETFSASLICVRGIHRSPVVSLTKASDAELWCFLRFAPEQTVEHVIKTPAIWDAIALIMTSLWWKTGSFCMMDAEGITLGCLVNPLTLTDAAVISVLCRYRASLGYNELRPAIQSIDTS